MCFHFYLSFRLNSYTVFIKASVKNGGKGKKLERCPKKTKEALRIKGYIVREAA